MECLLEVLAKLADPRSRRGVRHRLVAVLAIAVITILAGARSFREIGDQAADLPQEVLQAVGARVEPGGAARIAPSESTLRRAIQAIDAEHADRLLCAWIRDLTDRRGIGRTTIAIDGKTVRNSGGTRLFSAVAHGRAMTLAQLAVPDATTETTQVTTLLDPLDLTGVTVTADAAHTHSATAAYITGRDGHHLLPVKATSRTFPPGSGPPCTTSAPGPPTTAAKNATTAASPDATCGSHPSKGSTSPTPASRYESAASSATSTANPSANRSSTT